MNIGGQTTYYAVLGHPIGHSLSPCMHNAALRELGRNAAYLAFDVPPHHLPLALEALDRLGFGGLNLTIPLKEKAFAALSDLDASARLMRAVNTLVRTPRGWQGHNTDAYGLLRALEEAFACGVAGDRLFVLGVGGAGRTAALACARAGAAEIILADREPERARRTARELDRLATDTRVRIATDAGEQAALCREADLVIQATPVGMAPEDPSPLGDSAFRAGQRVFDMIYMYPRTALLAAARRAGAQTANGLGMLLHQGARALELWTNEKAPLEAMRQALKEAVYS